MSYLCLDTNILLLDAHNLLTLGQTSTIVLPEVVLDELDSKKSGLNELAFQAREFGRLLTKATKIETVRDGNLIINKLQLNSINIEVVSLKTYPDYSDSEPNIINDRKIIEVALSYQATNRIPLTFMSNDVMCRLRADSVGLNTAPFIEIEKTSFDFIKHLEVTDEQFSILHNKNIYDINPEHQHENYNYVFTAAGTAQHKLAYIQNNSIQVIGKATEDELRKQDISPINTEQIFLSRSIQDPTIDIIVVEALAGSGKTLLALSNAIKLVKGNSPYDSITYIRNSVDDVGAKDEEIGFLSGNEEKLNVYLHPLQDSLDTIIRIKYANSKLKGAELEDYLAEQRAKLISDCRIHGMIAIGTRGRTFTNSIIIIDEAQNISKATMVKLLTRIGKNCKVIITGSLRHIDSAYINKHTSGITTLLDACTKSHDDVNICAVPLSKVVRGKITAFAERIFSKSSPPK